MLYELDDETPSTADLLAAWRDTTRAAELAERLADVAADAADLADQNALASDEIAKMADAAAAASERAAVTARAAAAKAGDLAQLNRQRRLPEAETVLRNARDDEAAARDAYHQAEERARAARPSHEASQRQGWPDVGLSEP